MGATHVVEDIRLSTAVADLPGVGQWRLRQFERLGLKNVGDLIRHLPARYEQELAEGALDDLPMERSGSARGTLVATRYVQGAGGSMKGRFEATLKDHSDELTLVWFNASYLRDRLHAGMALRVQGKVAAYKGRPQMVNPRFEILDEAQTVPRRQERLRSVYPATEDLSSYVIERLMAEALPAVMDELIDPLPAELVASRHMPALADAYRMIHQPADSDEAAAARRRLAYNELLLLQLGIAIKRHHNRTAVTAPALHGGAAIHKHICERFGFELTASQRKIVRQIAADLQQSQPMNRLLQGDVGSGKTVVALYALLMAVADRRQGALMAPTELLAEQHMMSIGAMLKGGNVRLGLLTAGQGAARSAERARMLAKIEAGEVDLVIGTQALLTESVRFRDLAVVVIDEQHRFGVLQRAAFRSGPAKASAASALRGPHYLVMTATPIPRTLSLTIFGDLDVSTIKGLPPGRTPIVTRVVSPNDSKRVYSYLADRVAEGRQGYVVVPAIDQSDSERLNHLKNVRAHAKMLEENYFSRFKVAAIHGRLKQDTRQAIMDRFRRGEIDVLVATTVIEVGVDVPNATMMVVEHAERFGLAQLHQLRGRIGRGSAGHQNVCAFIAAPTTEQGTQRIAAIAKTCDGFKIAEQDLMIRGMGDFFGTRQHGMPALRVADIIGDMDLLQLARRDATAIVEADPQLADPSRRRLRDVLRQQYGDTLGLVDVG
jgi:ATP-dependent DNA helicase RecG